MAVARVHYEQMTLDGTSLADLFCGGHYRASLLRKALTLAVPRHFKLPHIFLPLSLELLSRQIVGI
jgi:hypothetical protein